MILRHASQSELSSLLDWAADEGWNPGLDDAGACWAADPEGFFVADVGQRIVAGISVVNHAADHAFLGLYLCHPQWRGRGIGFALWSHALRHAGDRSVGLDGVAAQQANYATSGFVTMGSTQRWTGRLDPTPFQQIRPATPGDLDRLTALDAAANGYDRPAFLRAWVRQRPSRTTVMLADGSGFATARLCRNGAKAGPVVADNAQTALQLVRASLHRLNEANVTIDVPASNADLAGLLKRHGFQSGFATARMVKGTAPRTNPILQAIATMELG